MTINTPPTNRDIQTPTGIDRGWIEWFIQTHTQSKFLGVDTTANRPTNALRDGDWYIDTTLGYPIWYYDGGWIDSAGATV